MTVRGLPQLQRRLKAIGNTDKSLRAAQLKVIAEAKHLVPRKTGNLGRSIVPGHVTSTEAIVKVNANYARYVEEGTGLYGPRHKRIVPRSASVLVWRTGGKSAQRLSGRSRVVGGKQLAGWAFAKSVSGRKATPFVGPAVKKVAKDTGIVAEIIKDWNAAA